MARDYKTKRHKPSKFSGWLGLACGLGLGAAGAGVIYLKEHRLDAPAAANAAKLAVTKRRSRANEPPDVPDARTDESTKSYAFYDMLPKFEVVVPEKDKNVRPDIKLVAETRPGTYMLQVGSYKNFSDADRSRAKLALLGVDSKVQKVTVDQDSVQDTWYRVRVGPIAKLDELNRKRQILHKAEIDALVIQVGD
jgi:cell division protein FtsN